MEAKDTVMSLDAMRAVLMFNCEEVEGGIKVAKAQAEISFKAGIREVVGWIKTQHFHSAGFDSPRGANLWMGFKYDEWQAKLEEWGIE